MRRKSRVLPDDEITVLVRMAIEALQHQKRRSHTFVKKFEVKLYRMTYKLVENVMAGTGWSREKALGIISGTFRDAAQAVIHHGVSWDDALKRIAEGDPAMKRAN